MRFTDLHEQHIPAIDLPDGVKHTLPHAVIFPDMDGEFDFYKFVVAMASHPDLDNEFYQTRQLRDVPMAVAYTPQEFEMIKKVAERLGQRWEELTKPGSQEVPGGNTVSPVMKFNMTEAHIDIMKALYEAMTKDEE
jgi:hypothetical protein